MAPMSGMIDHPLASRWHRFGRLLFAHGEQFYNFQGLRAFKEKFAPEWEPRYLVAPGGLGPFLALTDIAALTAGGFKGVISKCRCETSGVGVSGSARSEARRAGEGWGSTGRPWWSANSDDKKKYIQL